MFNTKTLQRRQQKAFLEAFAKLPSIKQAAAAAGISRGTHYDWLKADEEYRAAFDAANAEASETLEGEAWRRGVEGVNRDVYHQGKVVGHEREYSDRLIEILLKARMPAKYRERASLELSGAEGGPIDVVFSLDLAESTESDEPQEGPSD